MKEVGEDEDWALFWTDCSVALERCMDMKRYQVRLKYNKQLSQRKHVNCYFDLEVDNMLSNNLNRCRSSIGMHALWNL